MRVTFILLVLSLSLIGAATKADRASDDKATIRAAIADYIEGYYSCDAARMERSLHPHFLKHTISSSAGDLNIADKTGMEMVQEVRNKKKVTPVSDRKEEITIFAVDSDVASAKLVAIQWINYMTLLKQNGQWKIISVVKRNQE
jgi:putative lumazine-binding protein